MLTVRHAFSGTFRTQMNLRYLQMSYELRDGLLVQVRLNLFELPHAHYRKTRLGPTY